VSVNDLVPVFDAATDGRAIVKSLIVTALLWVAAFVLRALVSSHLRRRGLAPTDLRRLMATSRNLILFILAVATATVWFDELRTFAVSLVAVAAAIVIATKELIMGAGGTFLRTSSRMFDIGDRIELNGLRGDVIDTSLFTTTMLEIGPGRIGHAQTGRSITIPNAMLLSTPVINESFSSPFMIHTFEVPVAREHAITAEDTLRQACGDEIAAYLDEARHHFEARQRERGLEMPHLEPRILLRLDDATRVTLLATIVTPSRRKGWVEQAVLRRFLLATTEQGHSMSVTTTTPAT
jgi:small-conductance mechanosensitive channel